MREHSCAIAELGVLAEQVMRKPHCGVTQSQAFILLALAESRGSPLLRVQYFLTKVQLVPTGCLLWRGAKTGKGYGQFHMGDKTLAGNRSAQGAHCASYRLFVGPILEGLEIDHLCRTIDCVHPFHLEAVTHHTNLMRGNGISACYAKSPTCKRGHPKTPENTYYWRGKAAACRLCQALREKSRKRRRPLS